MNIDTSKLWSSVHLWKESEDGEDCWMCIVVEYYSLISSLTAFSRMSGPFLSSKSSTLGCRINTTKKNLFFNVGCDLIPDYCSKPSLTWVEHCWKYRICEIPHRTNQQGWEKGHPWVTSMKWGPNLIFVASAFLWVLITIRQHYSSFKNRMKLLAMVINRRQP